jgi:hypothetical protein
MNHSFYKYIIYSLFYLSFPSFFLFTFLFSFFFPPSFLISAHLPSPGGVASFSLSSSSSRSGGIGASTGRRRGRQLWRGCKPTTWGRRLGRAATQGGDEQGGVASCKADTEARAAARARVQTGDVGRRLGRAAVARSRGCTWRRRTRRRGVGRGERGGEDLLRRGSRRAVVVPYGLVV